MTGIRLKMLDMFATLYKKRCNNQFVVAHLAQRKPLGVCSDRLCFSM